MLWFKSSAQDNFYYMVPERGYPHPYTDVKRKIWFNRVEKPYGSFLTGIDVVSSLVGVAKERSFEPEVDGENNSFLGPRGMWIADFACSGMLYMALIDGENRIGEAQIKLGVTLLKDGMEGFFDGAIMVWRERSVHGQERDCLILAIPSRRPMKRGDEKHSGYFFYCSDPRSNKLNLNQVYSLGGGTWEVDPLKSSRDRERNIYFQGDFKVRSSMDKKDIMDAVMLRRKAGVNNFGVPLRPGIRDLIEILPVIADIYRDREKRRSYWE